MTRTAVAKTRRAEKAMRKRGWNHATPRNGIRRRMHALASDHHPWWDWGHRVMILTGSDMGGNWDAPKPPTWWYRQGPSVPMWRTGDPTHPPATYEVVTDVDEFRRRTEGLDDDAMYAWQAICVDWDGELQMGRRYWGKEFYGLPADDVPLLRRYLRMWRRHDWFGARSWLYSQALHAAVHRRKPGACHEVPPKGSGGYQHWHCNEKRRHAGPHRFGNYVWAAGMDRVEFAPEAQP